jgi:hypothetical protein
MKDLSFHGAAVGPDERGDEPRGGIVPIARTFVATGPSQMHVHAIIALALWTGKPVSLRGGSGSRTSTPKRIGSAAVPKLSKAAHALDMSC